MLGAHLAFLDESGFMLIPPVCRTWALRGQTPIVGHFYRRDRISAISALTVSPRRRHYGLYFSFQAGNIKTGDVAVFLGELLRHLRGHVVLLWDKALIHRGKPVQRIRQRFKRLHVECFPEYAPELNPTEYVWAQAKRRTANGSPRCVKELRSSVLKAVREIRSSQRLLKSCIRVTELSRK